MKTWDKNDYKEFFVKIEHRFEGVPVDKEIRLQYYTKPQSAANTNIPLLNAQIGQLVDNQSNSRGISFKDKSEPSQNTAGKKKTRIRNAFIASGIY